MYLLIGHESDLCVQGVARVLRDRGHRVLVTSNPLSDERLLSWGIETTVSSSTLAWPGVAALNDRRLQGVLVCPFGSSPALRASPPYGLPAIQAAMTAALAEWLRALPCTVINRPIANLWLRPIRSPLEWGLCFRRCGLPALAMHVAKDLASARTFAASWDGSATYTPLTSATRYSVVDDTQWNALARVIERVPVCLIEPTADPPMHVTIIGQQIFWAGFPGMTSDQQSGLERRLFRLAARFEAALLQVELRRSARGLRCSSASLSPRLDAHRPEHQEAMVAGIVGLLTAG